MSTADPQFDGVYGPYTINEQDRREVQRKKKSDDFELFSVFDISDDFGHFRTFSDVLDAFSRRKEKYYQRNLLRGSGRR